jgi:exonuclease III
MKLLTWNIRHGGGSPAIAAALTARDPDVIVLTEYRDPGSRPIVDQLRFFGWPHAATSPVTGLVNGVAIVSKRPLEPRPTPIAGVDMERWSVEAFLPSEALGIIGIYAPLSNSFGVKAGLQKRFWAGVHDLMARRAGERLILMGDFNTCAAGVDGPNPLPCYDAFEALPTFGWVDAWRAVNPNAKDFSYVDTTRPARTQWRIDHAFVSPRLAGHIRVCRYSHVEREQELSDHSILILELHDSAAAV